MVQANNLCESSNFVELYINKIGDQLRQTTALLDEVAGESGWEFRWDSPGKSLSFLGMCALYEDSYTDYFDEHPHELDAVSEYRDVYDIFESDTALGTNLDNILQEDYIHIQDVVIRRVMQKKQKKFSAASSALLQVRSTSEDELGRQLSPLFIPFDNPDIIDSGNPFIDLEGKMLLGSVEHFYKANRRLLISEAIPAKVVCEAFEAKFGETIQLLPVPVAVCN